MEKLKEVKKVKGLTPKQHAILQFIQRYITQHHFSPSYREIMDHFQLTSTGSVYQYLRSLQQKGFLTIDKQLHRGLQLTQIQESAEITQQIQIPWIGNLSIGYPLELYIQPQMIAVPLYLLHAPDNTYLLQIQGDALHSEWLLDGDLILIESRQNVLPGEIILGLINQTDSILKRYYPEGQSIRLESQQPQTPALTVRCEHIAIQGVLVGMLRIY